MIAARRWRSAGGSVRGFGGGWLPAGWLRHARRAAAAVLLAGAASFPAWAEEATGPKLPVRRVVMFSSGVAYFEHSGEVEGNARVDLRFNVEDVNDLLKSMVLEDLGGGQVGAVSYGSKDPITRTLKTFAIDLTDDPSLAKLLGQIRGERVELVAAQPLTGTLVGLETRPRVLGEDGPPVDVTFVTVLAEDGLRSVPLDSVTRIRLLDESLDAELRQALAVLALGHATDKKSVGLEFRGEGTRPVRVGYVQEAPLWKTSYRLLLPEEGKPKLQAWAIVENTTEDDWQGVELALVSGRPVSFRMDLYTPLYVPRPLVVPELFASLLPQVYGQDMNAANAEFEQLLRRGRKDAGVEAALGLAAEESPAPAGAAPMSAANGTYSADGAAIVRAEMAGAGVQSAAAASDLGNFFRYQIEAPVELARQQSAMLPIVTGEVEAERVSIYNAGVHAQHPLAGLRLTNSTGVHLMQGPITVYDRSTYAGDARIEDLPPGSERLLSYAMDLETEVAPEGQQYDTHLVTARLAKGTLIVEHKQARSQKYVVKNSGDETKQVLVEQPFDASWTLVAPQEPAERTRDLLRFAVTAEPGVPAELTVREEQLQRQELAIANLDDPTILFYVQAREVSEPVKQALQEVLRRKQAIGELRQRIETLNAELTVIDQEQARIRENMGRLDRNTELYNRYVKKFGEQEDRVEQLRAEVAQTREQADAAQRDLDQYLLGLELP